MKHLALQLLTLFYPATCRHCLRSLDNPFLFLCSLCQSHMMLCFETTPSHLYCFEQGSPAAALIKEAEKKGNRRLEQHMAAWMSFRMLQEKKELPDVLIPAIRCDIPYKSELNVSLAKNIATYSNIPALEAFQFVVDPQVYGEKGNLMGKIALHNRCDRKKYEGKKIGIISAEGVSTLPYANVLTQALSVVGISFLQPLA